MEVRRMYEEMGFAKLDTDREVRTGFPEVIYCAGKPDEYLVSIFRKMYEKYGEVFGTRATEMQYELVRRELPQVQYDPVSRILRIEKDPEEKAAKRIGRIAVCTAGTADIPVAEEAAQTAEYFGSYVDRVYDVGVSGLHRLLVHAEGDTGGKLCCGSGWNGGRTGERDRGTGQQSGHSGTDFHRVRGEYAWPVRTADDDQFLCERYRGSEYR